MQQTFGQGDVDAARNARLQSSHLSASSTTDAGATILPQQPQLKSAEQQDHLPPTPRWNTADLPLRVAGDMLAASAAAGLVAPIVTAIDKSIIENAANQRTITQSLRASALELVTRPQAMLISRPFGLVFLLYFATYMSANTVDTVSSTISRGPPPPSSQKKSRKETVPPLDPRHPASTTAGTFKFAATSATNLSLCVYKDTHFARLFGAASAAAPRPVPPASLALFAMRDAATVFASFILPSRLAPAMAAAGYPRSLEKTLPRAAVAQFVAPAAIQVFSTPVHLLGLDLYNRPGPAVGAADRAARVARDWAKSCAARIARILPAFGVGGVVNAAARHKWMMGVPSARTFE